MVIGVDPGLSGAIAVISTRGRLIHVTDMPTILVKRNGKKKQEIDFEKLGYIFRHYSKDGGIFEVFVEKVGSMPKQGVSSTFAFGKATGAVLAAPAALGIVVTQVLPVAWKKHFNLVSKEKDSAREFAISIWGDEHFARKKDCGRADAALIGLYGVHGGS